MTASIQLEIHEAPANSLERRYREWRESRVGRKTYPVFKAFALQMLERRRRFGIKALAERVRWEISLNQRMKPHEFKLNNDLTPYIARELIREVPALKDLIEVRRVKEGD